MNRHEMDWDELGAVWRTPSLDEAVLVAQLRKRMRRHALFRRLEVAIEILTVILAVLVGFIFWFNLEDEGLVRQITFEAALFVFIAGCFTASWWTRRGTGGEAQTLAAMIDLTIARAESTRKRIAAFAATNILAFLWGLAVWFLMLPAGLPEEEARQRAAASLMFILLWSGSWGIGTIAWAWWRWRRERQVLAQFLEIRRQLQ